MYSEGFPGVWQNFETKCRTLLYLQEGQKKSFPQEFANTIFTTFEQPWPNIWTNWPCLGHPMTLFSVSGDQ